MAVAATAVGGPVVGRETELAQGWRDLTAGGSVLVTGPTGSGKSTVLSALDARARAAGWTVLTGAPTRSEADLPLLTLADLLAAVSREDLARLDPPWRAALTAVSTGTTGNGHPPSLLTVQFAVRNLVRQLADQGDTLLVVDDLPWVDPASAQVLVFLARRCHGLPVRMVAAERSDGSDNSDGTHWSEMCPAPVRHLPLPPLPPSAVEALLQGHTGGSFGRATVQRIHATSGGNPLFALEIAHALRCRGRAGGPGEPLPVSDRLRELMRERLAPLSRSARRTLLLASIAARPITGLLQRRRQQPGNRRPGRRGAAGNRGPGRRGGAVPPSVVRRRPVRRRHRRSAPVRAPPARRDSG